MKQRFRSASLLESSARADWGADAPSADRLEALLNPLMISALESPVPCARAAAVLAVADCASIGVNPIGKGRIDCTTPGCHLLASAALAKL